ncbi:MAG: PIN domain-containing protein [Calditrichaeota bacterium]|nr:MAG: PIN domain-containing protein [Calditrichota bacterium]MBL1204812.1 PIN domain-containing protein [Calditrichota bacterium]NOG44641.1 type II toxin-antitoxin system VapC family toxin [Calditrichota bacterium]
MLLLDTHVWVFYYTKQFQHLSKPALDAINNEKSLAISPISGWELAQLVKKKRVKLEIDIIRWISLTRKDQRLLLLDLSLDILVQSVQFDDLHKDPADRIIAATSIVNSIPLITADKKLLQYSKLDTIW